MSHIINLRLTIIRLQALNTFFREPKASWTLLSSGVHAEFVAVEEKMRAEWITVITDGSSMTMEIKT